MVAILVILVAAAVLVVDLQSECWCIRLPAAVWRLWRLW